MYYSNNTWYIDHKNVSYSQLNSKLLETGFGQATGAGNYTVDGKKANLLIRTKQADQYVCIVKTSTMEKGPKWNNNVYIMITDLNNNVSALSEIGELAEIDVKVGFQYRRSLQDLKVDNYGNCIYSRGDKIFGFILGGSDNEIKSIQLNNIDTTKAFKFSNIEITSDNRFVFVAIQDKKLKFFTTDPLTKRVESELNFKTIEYKGDDNMVMIDLIKLDVGEISTPPEPECDPKCSDRQKCIQVQNDFKCVDKVDCVPECAENEICVDGICQIPNPARRKTTVFVFRNYYIFVNRSSCVFYTENQKK